MYNDQKVSTFLQNKYCQANTYITDFLSFFLVRHDNIQTPEH